jgi:quinol monooxygenase YgiN
MRHFCVILRFKAVKKPAPRKVFPLDGAGAALPAASSPEEALMETVHVLAIITAEPGRRAELLQAFQANVPSVHAEEGCLEYVATVDAVGAGSVHTRFGEDSFRAWLPRPTTKVGLERHVVEKWASLAALKAHAAAPHMAAYAARTRT